MNCRMLFSALAASVLVACGGGGTDGSSELVASAELLEQKKIDDKTNNGNAYGRDNDKTDNGNAFGRDKEFGDSITYDYATRTLIGTPGADRLEDTHNSFEIRRMKGGPGADVYVITRETYADLEIVEKGNDGIDTVITSRNVYTLPENVENLEVGLAFDAFFTLNGNNLNNRITGFSRSTNTLNGLGGNDTLISSGSGTAILDGGEGDDRLIASNGSLTGGPGADTFVAVGVQRASPADFPIRVKDFNAEEGDRLEIAAGLAFEYGEPVRTVEELVALGYLTFNPATSELRLNYLPEFERAVRQIFVLEGVTSFDPAWLTISSVAP
jgi:hypothetical protein